MTTGTDTPVAEIADDTHVTRLMCAGTYLDHKFRTSVIKHLLHNRHRDVAPSYGYDAVPVLGHALAARALSRKHSAVTVAGLTAVLILRLTGLVTWIIALLMVAAFAWAVGFLRRLAILENLIAYFGPGTAFAADGYPPSPALTPKLVAKISHEQVANGEAVYYGGYDPFVGSGNRWDQWSNAQLLTAAPRHPLLALEGLAGFLVQRHDGGQNGEAEPRVIPFTVEEITTYVTEHMEKELRDDLPAEMKIDSLVIECRKFRKATGVKSAGADPDETASGIHWDEHYDAAREYLCIRVESWKQEVITSMFVGFDLKGGTLHTEFYAYLLPPVREVFHLADRLPEAVTRGTVFRVAWQSAKSTPRDALKLVRDVQSDLASRLSGRFGWKAQQKLRRDEAAGYSEFGLGRFMLDVVDRGPTTSIRQEAASRTFLHFFQKADVDKYVRIVERRLLRIIESFLAEHNVDLADHRAHQTNILQRGDTINHSGTGHIVSRTKGDLTLTEKLLRRKETQEAPTS